MIDDHDMLGLNPMFFIFRYHNMHSYVAALDDVCLMP